MYFFQEEPTTLGLSVTTDGVPAVSDAAVTTDGAPADNDDDRDSDNDTMSEGR